MWCSVVVLLAALACPSTAFKLLSNRRSTLKMHFDEAGTAVLDKDAQKAERYIACNRFKVKPLQGPKFEKRWAERKSRLSELDGFRFFSLLKRINDDGTEYVGEEPQYISFTTWENKENFDAWRAGDAFKEAHGGTGFAAISGFVQLLTTALFILEGGPKPCFYDGLIPVVNDGATSNFVVEGGWRKVAADGVNYLNPDVFVAQNRFNVMEGKEVAFEGRWKDRESKLKEYDGFMGFYLQRRDALKADDGYNYISTSIWKDKASFEVWRNAQNSPSATPHGSGGGAAAAGPVGGDLVGRPSVCFYEGKLALASPRGA